MTVYDKGTAAISNITGGGGIQPPSERYYSFDTLKALCTFLVVCIHCPFVDPIGEYIKTITRCAVPVFFLISGFFYASGNEGRWRKQAKRIALLMIGANLLYFLWSLMLSVYGGYFDVFKSDLFSLKKWAVFLLLNDSMFSFHLWYLGAILYTMVMFRFFKSIGKNRILLYATPFLILLSLVVGKYSKILLGIDIPLEYSRNWLLVGVPFYAIGAYVFDNKEKLIDKGNISVSIVVLIALSIVGIMERYLLVSSGMNAAGDIFFATPLLAITLFFVFFKNVGAKASRISDLGKRYTTSIYVLHVMVDKVILFAVIAIGARAVYGFVRPVVVYFLTLFFAMLIQRIIAIRKRYRNVGIK